MNTGINLTTLLYALAAGIIPSLIWLFFWTREDHSHEPKKLLTGLFLCGMLGTIVALFGEKIIASYGPDTFHKYLYWAILEEFIKFTTVAIIAFKSSSFDEPIDAMIYFVTVALGFAALENTLFILFPFSSGNITAGIITGNLRFIGATLIHIICSGIIGFAIGLTFYKNWFSKIISVIIAFIVASSIHTIFNLSIVNTIPNEAIKVFAWVWVAAVMLIVLFEEVKSVRPKLI